MSTRTITISFTKPRGKFQAFSWLIRGLWGTKYSHVSIAFNSIKYNRRIYYHASGLGLNFTSESLFKSANEVVYSKELLIPEDIYHQLLIKSMDLAGTKYGLLQAIGVGLSYLASKLNLPRVNPFADGRSKWICSEWAAYALSLAYPDFKPDLETISPLEIYNFVKNLP